MANTDKRFTPIGGGPAGHSYFTVASDDEGTDRYECACGYASFFRDGANSIAEHIAAAAKESA